MPLLLCRCHGDWRRRSGSNYVLLFSREAAAPVSSFSLGLEFSVDNEKLISDTLRANQTMWSRARARRRLRTNLAQETLVCQLFISRPNHKHELMEPEGAEMPQGN